MPTRRRVLSAYVVLAVAALSSSTVAAQTRNWDGIAALCQGRNLRACVDEQVLLMDLASFTAAALAARNVHASSSMGHPDNVNGQWMLTGWEFAQILHQDVGGSGGSAPTTFDDSPLTTVDDSPLAPVGGSASLGYKPAGEDVFLDFIAPADDLTPNTGISSAGAPGDASLGLCTSDADCSIASLETTTAPEPGTIVLLATGMAGLVAWRRRRDRPTLR